MTHLLRAAIALCVVGASAPKTPKTPNVAPGVSAGPVRFGMTRQEVRKTVGVKHVNETVLGAEYDGFHERGLEVRYDAEGRVREIFLFGAVASGYPDPKVTRTPFDLLFPGGVTFRSTYDEVLAALGEPSRRGQNTSADIPYRWLAYPGVTFHFEARSQTLSEVALPGFVPLTRGTAGTASP